MDASSQRIPRTGTNVGDGDNLGTCLKFETWAERPAVGTNGGMIAVPQRTARTSRERDLRKLVEANVSRLHRIKAFANYGIAKAVAIEDGRSGFAKLSHPTSRDVNMAHGQVLFLGDVPFSVLLRDVVSADPPIATPSQPEINLKVGSIREAIREYVHPDVFDEYLRLFTDRLELPLAMRELKAAWKIITIQFAREQTVGTFDAGDLEKCLNHQGDEARDAARGAFEKRESLAHPELVLAFSVYLAAHRAYLSHFRHAVKRHHLLCDEERDNAQAVLDDPFRFFVDMTIFETLLPIILHERNLQNSQQQAQLSDDERTKLAIDRGWERFDKARILRTDSLTQLVDGVKHPLIMICPAKQHFRESRNRKHIDSIFTTISENRDSAIFIDLVRRTEEATRTALTSTTFYQDIVGGDTPYYPHAYFETAKRLGIDIGNMEVPLFPQPSLIEPTYDADGIPRYDRPSPAEKSMAL